MRRKNQIIFLLILSCVFVSCENVWETELANTKKELKITTSNDYVATGNECWVSISTGNTTILTQKIENSKTYTFPNPPARADLHVYFWNATNKILDVSTYAGVTLDELFFDNKINQLSNIGSSTFTIPDAANFLRWGLSSSIASGSTTNPSSKSIVIPISLNPDHLFAFLIPADGTAPRYKYLQNASPGSVSTFNMSSLNVMTNYFDVNIPVNSFLQYFVGGYNNSIYTDHLQFLSNVYSQGLQGNFRVYYPSGIRGNFQSYFSYTSGNYGYIFRKLGTIPSNPFQALPNITISSSSQLRGATTTVSNFSSMERLIVYSNYIQTTSNIRVRWIYTKRPESSNTVVIPDFPTDIQNRIGTISVSNLPLTYVSYSDYSAGIVTSYDSFIEKVVKQSEPFWDLIREARTFIRYPDAKQNIMGIESEIQ